MKVCTPLKTNIHHWPLPIASEVEAVPFSQAVTDYYLLYTHNGLYGFVTNSRNSRNLGEKKDFSNK